MASSEAGIQKLLSAENEAKKIVADARAGNLCEALSLLLVKLARCD